LRADGVWFWDAQAASGCTDGAARTAADADRAEVYPAHPESPQLSGGL